MNHRLDHPPARMPREERWREILQHTMELFREHGYRGTSLRDVAQRVGIHKGSLYYYIESKQDLLEAIIAQAHRSAMRFIEDHAGREQRAVIALHGIIKAHANHVLEHALETSIIIREIDYLEPARRERVLGKNHSFQSVFRDLIAKAQNQGEVFMHVDPDIAALTIIGSINWASRWYRPEGPLTKHEVASQMANYHIRALLNPRGLHALEASGLSV